MAALTSIVGDLAAIEASLRAITPAPGPVDTPDEAWPACLDDSQLLPGRVEVSQPWGYESYLRVTPAIECHRCIEGEIETRDARGYRVMVPCRCQPLRRAADLVNRAQIAAQFDGATQARYDWSLPANGEQVREGIAAALKAGRGVVLVGSTGTGKSHLAVSIIRRAALRRESSRWWRWQTLVEALTAAEFRRFEAHGIDLAEMVKRVLAGKWLVIDDLLAGGTAKMDRQGDILRMLLERAMDLKIRLVVTSNLTLDEIGRQVRDSARILSRLTAVADEIVVVGEDQRVRNGRR